jgi:hypothetical protein
MPPPNFVKKSSIHALFPEPVNTERMLSVEKKVENSMAQPQKGKGWLLALSLTAGAVAGAVVAYQRFRSQESGKVETLMDVAERAAKKLDDRLEIDRYRARA